jgi:hypothetical protein
LECEEGKKYSICTRSSIKNYENQIERFLEWLKPYIEYGSGYSHFYAIVTYEEGDPVIYSLRNEIEKRIIYKEVENADLRSAEV